MRDHQRSVRRFWHMPQCDPALTPLKRFGPALLLNQIIEQAVNFLLEHGPKPFPFEDHPILIKAWQEFATVSGDRLKQDID